MGMVKLQHKLRDRNFQILAFPCNQFGGQEPNSNSVVEAFAATKSSYGATTQPANLANPAPFPMFAKSTVNAPMCPSRGRDHCVPGDASAGDGCCGFNNPVYEYLRGHASDHGNIPWNFAKFLVDSQGNVVSRYRSTTDLANADGSAADIEDDILPLLAPPAGSGH
eukprot:SAG22_NODE_679_length_7944_cov_2.240408_4_plen_166_part_00